MTQQIRQIPVSSIILDEDIYPRKGIDNRRVGIFAENIRDGFIFDPIEVELVPDKTGEYRLLDGAHRWSAYKSTGKDKVDAIIQELDGIDSLLYAAKKAIGPRQLTEDEAKDTARRAYTRNTGISSEDIGKAIGRARRTVDSYIADLRAVNQMDKDLKIFRMNRLGIPQDRIAKKMGLNQASIHNHLLKMATLPNLINSDLSQGFTVSQVAQKHGWPEPMVWSLALEGKDDCERFKELGWGLRTWDQWEFNTCDKRFGDEWPGRIPAQLIAHIFFYFSKPNDLILDPMAGGGVTPDTCLAMGRRCWAFDLMDLIEPKTFMKRFGTLIDRKYYSFFVKCEVEAIADLRSFAVKLSKLNGIYSISANVSPPNPLFGPLWEDLKVYLEKRRTDKMKIHEESLDDKMIETSLPSIMKKVASQDEEETFLDQKLDIGDAAILMAADGYGSGYVKGKKGGDFITIRTSETIKNFTFLKDVKPEKLFEKAYNLFKKIKNDRHMKHDE